LVLLSSNSSEPFPSNFLGISFITLQTCLKILEF
jgi:hypothetical protein